MQNQQSDEALARIIEAPMSSLSGRSQMTERGGAVQYTGLLQGRRKIYRNPGLEREEELQGGIIQLPPG